MSLTKDDLQAIKVIVVDSVNDAFSALAIPRFDEIENRFEQIDQRLGTIEQDVSTLKQDVTTLKQDVSILKQDVSEVKENTKDLQGMRADIKALYKMVAKLQHDYGEDIKRDKAMAVRMQRVEHFIDRLSAQSGIPFKV